jgi:hypothetical protein
MVRRGRTIVVPGCVLAHLVSWESDIPSAVGASGGCPNRHPYSGTVRSAAADRARSDHIPGKRPGRRSPVAVAEATAVSPSR